MAVEPFKGRHAGDIWTWDDGEKARFAAHLKGLKDGRWEIPAAKRPTRSEKANAYYWSTVVRLCVEHTGQSDDEFHSAMCQMFLPDELKRVEFFNRLTGEVMQVTIDKRRSSKLTGAPFYDFVEQVRLWAMDFLGVFTPDPNPDYWRKRDASHD